MVRYALDDEHVEYFEEVRRTALLNKDKIEYLKPEECDWAPYEALVRHYMAELGAGPRKLLQMTTNCSLYALSLSLLGFTYQPSEVDTGRARELRRADKIVRRYILLPMDVRWFYEITRRYAVPFWTTWSVPVRKKRGGEGLYLWKRDGYAPLALLPTRWGE